MLLLADGYRINDNIDDQAFIGTDYPVDHDLIDRVEVIRGPNSSLYVASALLAVINVVTKPVRNARGLEASAELASWGAFKSRLTYGHQFASGLAMLLSGSYYNSQGHDALYFAEFDTPSTNHGMALNLDGDVSRQLFATFSLHNFRLEAAYGSRQKDVPTASYGSLFNVSPNYTVDTREYVDLQYDRAFGSNWGLLGHLYYDRYPFENAGIFDFSPLGGPTRGLNKSVYRGEWWGAEFALSKKLVGRQTLIIGSEYRDNFQQDQADYLVQPLAYLLNDHRHSTIDGVYAQDEFRLRHGLVLDLGVRYDRYSTFGGTINPRAALIYRPLEKTTLKLLYGQSFRAPNAFELYDQTANGAGLPIANPNLRPETARPTELVLEQNFNRQIRLIASGYYYPIRGLISEETDPSTGALVYENSQRVNLQGAEVTLKRQSRAGLEAGITLSFEDAKNVGPGIPLPNSPRTLGQANLSLPLFHRKLFASTNLEFVSRRRTLAGQYAAGYLLPNLTLFSTALRRWEVSASLYNAFDHVYSDPGGPERQQDLLRQDGLAFRLKLAYRFF